MYTNRKKADSLINAIRVLSARKEKVLNLERLEEISDEIALKKRELKNLERK
jgi:hypothetical protein